jgi:GNAT superfamily N-acetyltransferase
MRHTVAVRKYQDADRENCHALWRELTEWHREIYQDPTIGGEHPGLYFDKYLTNIRPAHVWVATIDSKAVGLIGLIIKEDEAEIEPLIVSKPYRRRGIGKQLVETAINEARNAGIKFLNIAPVARNVHTIKYVYNLGFQKLGFVQLFIDFSGKTWKPGLKLHGCSFDY